MQNTSAYRRLFVAGATGTVGGRLLAAAAHAGVPVVPHVRPARAAAGHPAAQHTAAAVLELADRDSLIAALAPCTTIVQTIGTMRKRFAAGDTYQTSDIGSTRYLADAASAAGTIDHFVLLSSVGAGHAVGAYLRAKAQAEAIVRSCGIPFTIVRPSAFDGGPHKPPRFLAFGLDSLARLGAANLAATYRPIRVDVLAALLLHICTERSHLGAVLEGRALWQAVATTETA